MAYFISNAITNRGRILLGEAQVGATFEATKIVMGSGHIPSGSTAANMTAVVTPVIELEINKKKRAGDGTVTFGGAFSNETITEAFYFREFALYARVQYADGTYGDEVLYSYGNAGGNADLIPAYSTTTVVEKQMDIVVYVGNETQVNLTLDRGLYTPHSEKHAKGGEDPITPGMIGAVSKTGDTMTGDLTIEKSIPRVILKGTDGSDARVGNMSDGVYMQTNDVAGSNDYRQLRLLSQSGTPNQKDALKMYDKISGKLVTVLHTGNVDYITPEMIDAAANHAFVSGVNLLEWASEQTVGGPFFTNNDVTGVPSPGFWHGILTMGADDGDKGLFIFNGTEAHVIATMARVFDRSEWREFAIGDFLPLAGGTLNGSLSVNYGSGTLLSWLIEGETATAIEAYRANNVGRLHVAVYDDKADAYLSFADGKSWTTYQLLHTGNAPAVIAAAELV